MHLGLKQLTNSTDTRHFFVLRFVADRGLRQSGRKSLHGITAKIYLTLDRHAIALWPITTRTIWILLGIYMPRCVANIFHHRVLDLISPKQVYDKLRRNLKTHKYIDLNKASPKLLKVKDLDLSVPGQ